MGQLDGKTVIVTGAASGIGREMVDLFLVEGASVVAADIDARRLEALEQAHPEVTCVAGDVSTPEGAESIISAAGDSLDVLCNNAGIIDALAPIDETSDRDWERVMAVNLRGPFLLSRRAIEVMLPRGGGSIVNTASVAGLRGGRAGAAYTASKFGVIGLTLNIAVTHGDRGIRCNAICPGSVATDIASSVEMNEIGRRLTQRDREKPAAAHPREIAAVAVFLASDAASRINGTTIPVDSGWIAY
jgi:NAD(P)-dependent dehydrogenase (short-subunit alcohol dehydrogenase family)